MDKITRRLQAIRERLERATPGPWTIARRQIGKMLIVIKDNGPSQTPRTICQFPSQSPTIETQINRQGNSEFIAHSPQDIAFLLQAVEVMNEKLEELKGKEGFCIYGTTDLADNPEQAFRQGSAYTYSECAAIAQEALTAIEKLAGEG